MCLCKLNFEIIVESIHLKEKKHNLLPGDNVEVIDGELINLRGKVQGVDGDKILILPEHEELKEPLTLNAFELRKYFKVGDHVRVIGGRYEGDTGLIVRVEDNMIILLSGMFIIRILCLLPYTAWSRNYNKKSKHLYNNGNWNKFRLVHRGT